MGRLRSNSTMSGMGIEEFWVTQTLNGCESERAKISITVNPPSEISGSLTSKPAWFAGETIIDETISVKGAGIITNPKVYIATGFQNGDVLSYTGALPDGITQGFDESTGSLSFTGSGDSETWQEIFSAVKFSTTSINTSDREISFLISDVVALTVNGRSHYYQYISGNTTWANARASASTKNLFGLTGYLATIGSKEENDFIMNKLQSDGWVGGSDDFALINAALGTNTFANQGEAEGKWYWVTGPEKGTAISLNNLSPETVNGAFMNWNGTAPTSEPNNAGGEHYMQLFSSNDGKWNDLPASFSLAGYVVEFGGYGSDPDLAISHTRLLQHDARPTVALSSAATSATNAPFTVNILFSEAVTGFTEEDISVTNATVSSFSTVGASEYTIIVTPLVEGEVKVGLPADACRDNISTGNAPSNVLSRLYDVSEPSAVLTTPAPDPLNTSFYVTATFSEVVSGFDSDDINVNNATKSDFTVINATTFTVKVTPVSDGPVIIEVASEVAQDNAGNGNSAAAKLTRGYDHTNPAITITSVSSHDVNAPFAVTLTFSEPVFGFDVSDLALVNASASDFTKVTDATYTVMITPATEGTVGVTVVTDVAVDEAKNANKASESFARNYDSTKPDVSLVTAAPLVTNGPYTIAAKFSEEVAFGPDDIKITNGTTSDFTVVSGSEYTLLITPTGEGDVVFEIPGDAAMDAAGNGNSAAARITRKYDVTPPEVLLKGEAGQATNVPFTITFSFSEPVTGFEISDVTVFNGTAGSFMALSDTEFTVTIMPAVEGEVAVDVIENSAADAAGNGVEVSASFKREYDVTNPAAVLTSSATNPTNSAVPVTIMFGEAVTGFGIDDLIVNNGTPSSFVQVSDKEYTVIVIPAADGLLNVSLAPDVASDAAGNRNTPSEILARIYDSTAPTGYDVTFAADQVNLSNVSNVSLNVHRAEPGATYTYEIGAADGSVIRGTGQVHNDSFTLSDIDLASLPDGVITLSFVLKDEAGNAGMVKSVEITKVTRNVIAIAAPVALSVPIRTSYAQLVLPASVEVTYSTQEKEFIGVTWSIADYDGFTAGEYILPGELMLAPATTNLNSLATTLKVKVEENIAPSGIFISNSVFSPDINEDVAIAEFTTEDADDTAFIYALVNGTGSTDNGFFIIDGDKLYLKDNHGLSGRTEFSIRVRSADPYSNIIESVFSLGKSNYDVVNIKIPTTFSPNGDGINDTWVPSELRFYNDVVVEIFDRSGVRLYITNDPEAGWDGRLNNGKILEGPFFYIIHIGDLNQIKKGVIINLR